MSAAFAPTMSARGVALVRTLRATFEALTEHQKVAPGEVLELAAFVMSHVRSAWPQATIDTPALDLAPASNEPPIDELERPICDRGKYRLQFDDGHLALVLTDDQGDIAVAVMTPAMAEALRTDIARVMGGR